MKRSIIAIAIIALTSASAFATQGAGVVGSVSGSGATSATSGNAFAISDASNQGQANVVVNHNGLTATSSNTSIVGGASQTNGHHSQASTGAAAGGLSGAAGLSGLSGNSGYNQ